MDNYTKTLILLGWIIGFVLGLGAASIGSKHSSQPIILVVPANVGQPSQGSRAPKGKGDSVKLERTIPTGIDG